MTVDLLAELLEVNRAILGELRRMRADRHREAHLARLHDALLDEFADSPFTSSGVQMVVADEPGGALAEALAGLIDPELTGRARATAIGKALVRVPGVTVEGSRRGSALYRIEGAEDVAE